MALEIDLVPQEEKKEQKKQSVVKVGTVVTIIFLFIVVGLSAYMFFKAKQLRDEISLHNERIEKHRADITDLSQIEVSARNLDKKTRTLNGILSSRMYYSKLMTELEKRLPSSMSIETFSIGRDSTINVSGYGTDYISIAKFVRSLTDTDLEGAGEGLEGLFTDVTLNSVSLDKQTSLANYFIVITYDAGLLHTK